jgi:hypothetical protein
MNREFLNFTVMAYREIISTAAKRYRFITLDESLEAVKGAVWRHDIDVSPQRALAIASIEANNGVHATYFFQVSSRFYNIFEPEIACVLRQIIKLGHDIGLHFDAEVFAHKSAPDYEERIAFEANVLEKIIESKVRSFTLHNPTTMGDVVIDDTHHAGLINGSCSMLRKSYAYCSDSNGLWQYSSLKEMIADPAIDHIYALTHPEWWQEEPMPPRHRLQRCIDGRKLWTEKYYDNLLIDNNRPNIGR